MSEKHGGLVVIIGKGDYERIKRPIEKLFGNSRIIEKENMNGYITVSIVSL